MQRAKGTVPTDLVYFLDTKLLGCFFYFYCLRRTNHTHTHPIHRLAGCCSSLAYYIRKGSKGKAKDLF